MSSCNKCTESTGAPETILHSGSCETLPADSTMGMSLRLTHYVRPRAGPVPDPETRCHRCRWPLMQDPPGARAEDLLAHRLVNGLPPSAVHTAPEPCPQVLSFLWTGPALQHRYLTEIPGLPTWTHTTPEDTAHTGTHFCNS